MQPATEEDLREIACFKSLSPNDLRLLAGNSWRHRYPGDHVLFEEGDAGHVVYAIISGRVVIRREGPGSGHVIIAERGPGEFFGEMAVMGGRPRMAQAVTDGDCQLVMLDGRSFRNCMEVSTRLSRIVALEMAERLRQASEQVYEGLKLAVPQRVAGWLTRKAEVIGYTENGPGPLLPVLQSRVAAEVHTTRESVNRALGVLQREGLIRRHNRFVEILCVERLRRFERGRTPS
jgi:CRP-like cAMP-binding protein